MAPLQNDKDTILAIVGLKKIQIMEEGLVNIVIFSSLPWDFLWQRPQQIASRLAKRGYNIVYFENPVYLDSATKLKERIQKKQFIDIIPKDDHLWIIKIYFPPFRGKFRTIKDKFVNLCFRYCLRKLGFNVDLALFYCLDFVPQIKTLHAKNIKIAFDFVDDILSFPEYAFTHYKQQQSQLITSSSVVFATSSILCNKVAIENPKCFYLPNAMDFDHFNAAATGPVHLIELANVKHPVIGFIGAFLEWVDDGLVLKLAQTHPEYSILIVGPVDIVKDKFAKYPNIIMVGTKPYHTLPSYLSNIDVCIIPFKINNITLAANPIKMYEYLAAGKPVVSTALPEVIRNASEVVYIGKDNDDFIKKVELAVKESNEKDSILIKNREEFAKKNSWDSRVEVIDSLLREIVQV